MNCEFNLKVFVNSLTRVTRFLNLFYNFYRQFSLYYFLISFTQKHYYQPMFTLIGGGMKKLEDSYQPMADVLPALAKWLRDSVVEFDPDQNTVRTKNGDTIQYDQMLIATGLELKYEKIPGVVEALKIPGGRVCSNYSPNYVGRTFTSLQGFETGNAIFSYPNSPVKCPGAPQKIMYIAEHYLRRVGQRRKQFQGQDLIQEKILILFYS